MGGFARRTLGLTLLAFTVSMWTASNFLASSIFSDGTYDKPFFVVYINTSIFAISLIPMSAWFLFKNGMEGTRAAAVEAWHDIRYNTKSSNRTTADPEDGSADQRLLEDDQDGTLELSGSTPSQSAAKDERLTLRETAILSLEFCMLWFAANYFASACLQYTSVASATIFTSLSGLFTLLFCALRGIEAFTWRKLIGVLASVAGVILISSLDMSGKSDENRGDFPEKTQKQTLIGDAMALLSAAVYGLYVTVMKTRVENEDRVNMPLFFGLVGIFNVLFLWPGFIILHFTGVETFEMPPTGEVWKVIWLNSFSSFFSDMSWAYAMLLTTPLIVTVGLSLTIPASLIVEMIWYSQFSSIGYWIGAGVILCSFFFINHESHDDLDDKLQEEQVYKPLDHQEGEGREGRPSDDADRQSEGVVEEDAPRGSRA